MSGKPQTIQIYLPNGDPQGIRIAEMTTGIVRIVDVPSALLDEYLAMDEAQQVGMYFLIGEGPDEEFLPLYIGETGTTGKRLQQHKVKKDYWTRALVVVTRTDSMTQTHAAYVEWLAVKEAKAAGRYKVMNGNGGSKPHTPKPLEADCLHIFDAVRILVATLGQPMFEPLKPPNVAPSQDELFYCKSAHYDATALHTPDGMVVLKGSKAKKDVTPHAKGTFDKRREALIAEGTLVLSGNYYEFQKDVLFKSPSGAAGAVCGASVAGWGQWKTKAGKTLDEVKRQPALGLAVSSPT